MQLINQKLYDIPRVFIQGDRDPEGVAKQAALQLGQALKTKGWGATVGAYGGFVQVLEESGVSCICHETRIHDHGDVKMKSSPSIKCQELGQKVILELGDGAFSKAGDEISWGIRLGLWMGMSQSYCFFAGREGTLAHLVPVLAYNIKGWAKQGKARKVCLIGWEMEDVDALSTLFMRQGENDWLRYFTLNNIGDAAEFLTS